MYENLGSESVSRRGLSINRDPFLASLVNRFDEIEIWVELLCLLSFISSYNSNTSML